LSPARAVTLVAAALALLTSGKPAFAQAAPYRASIDSTTWVDHDARPIPKPKEREISLYGYMFRQALVEPISHLFDVPDKMLWLASPLRVKRERHSANTNAFDEVPNSTWFTNRNHVRSVPPSEVRTGPFGGVVPAKPWTVKDLKKSGHNPGFQIKDAEGRKWLIKLDKPENPQAISGAGTVVSRLVWAAGYNIALFQPVTFRREDLRIETKAAAKSGTAAAAKPASASKQPSAPAKEDPPITEEDLERILKVGARSADGRYYAGASFLLPGKPAGPPDLRGRRKDDPNDWYEHKNRRDLRGLYVLYSWLNNWDVKDQQSLDMYDAHGEDPGHLVHYILDVDASLGAAAEGAKALPRGYEMRVDFPWTLRRLLTLGFVVEPWRRAHQESGIPAVGNLESEVFHPRRWKPLEEVPPFRKLTPRDAYWGAKLVASFTNAQIAAAIDAAGYEDPRASEYIFRMLVERRDKVARYWFDRVAPLDFFRVEHGVLRFHDLALDLGQTGPRAYDVEVDASGGRAPERVRLTAREMTLPESGAQLHLTFSLSGSGAKPVRVELRRKGSGWVVARVRHA
jgi:hypothetical protein